MKAISGSGLVLLTYVCYAHALLSPQTEFRDDHKADKGVPSLGVPQSVQQTWAMFAPYYPADQYAAPPEGCSIDQVRLTPFPWHAIHRNIADMGLCYPPRFTS